MPSGPYGCGVEAVTAAHAAGVWCHSFEGGASTGLECGLPTPGPGADQTTATRRPCSLLRIPGRFQVAHVKTKVDATGLYDTGASKSFMSVKLAERLKLSVKPGGRGMRVSNGDGSFQQARGEVTIKMAVGERFKETFTFVVIDLAVYDFIIGLPDIRTHRMELKGDPMRVTVPSSPRPGGAKRAVELPIIIAKSDDDMPYTHSLYSKHDFDRIVGDDPVYVILPDPDGSHAVSSASRHEGTFEEELDWMEMLHNIKTELAAEGHDTAAIDEAEQARRAAYDPDQERLQKTFPATFADELPEHPSSIWPPEERYARLRFKEGAVPKSARQFRLPEALRPQLQRTIEDMLAHGLIEPHDGTGINSPVLFAPKPGSTEMRFCFDCRALNKTLADYHYPSPTTEELLDRVARVRQEAKIAGVDGPVWYSKADARHGYFQIEVHPDDRKYLGFTVPVLHGSYRYTVLPMGLSQSSAEFQKRMDVILSPIANRTVFDYDFGGKRGTAIGTATCYCDDLLCISVGTREEHEALVYKTFSLFAKHNIVFKLSKTALFRQEIEFLGHTLTQTGVKQQLGKTSAIVNWPPITSVAELRSFIGLASYYRKFIHGFAKIIAPLSDLLREGHFISPLPAPAEKAFLELKRAMTSAPVLKYFDATHETQLWTDASGHAIGGALLQRDERGALRPVGYYSRRLSPAEEKYSTYARELLAIRDCLLAFRYYLIGLPFVVKTDHCSLKWIMEQRELSGIQARWMSVIQNFQITEIQYVPGEKNVLADALSRTPDPTGETFEHLVPPFNMEIHNLEDSAGSATPSHDIASPDLLLPQSQSSVTPWAPVGNVVLSGVEHRPWRADSLRTQESVPAWQNEGWNVSVVKPTTSRPFDEMYASCPDFAAPWDARLDPRSFAEIYPDFHYLDEAQLLVHASPGGVGIGDDEAPLFRLCVPSALRVEVLKECHDSTYAGHMGFARTAQRVAAEFYWPKMEASVAKFCESCEVCQRSKPYTARARGVPSPLETPSGRWKVVSLDIINGLPPSGPEGFDCVVVFTDRFTKQAYFCPAKFKGLTARVVADLFVQHVFRSQGIPKVLLSDRDSKFTSVFWERLFELLGTKLLYSASYHHQSNGQVERLNQTLTNFLRAYCGQHDQEWHQQLAIFEFSYNSSKHAATSFEPFVLVYGEVPPALITLVNADKVRSKDATDLAMVLVNARVAARDALQEASRRYRELHEKARRGHAYQVGDRVLLSTEHLALRGQTRKTFPKFVGPFKVVATRGINNVELECHDRFRYIDPVVNIERLRPFKSREDETQHEGVVSAGPGPIMDDPRGGSWWEVEDVVAHVGRSRKDRRYLVRYLGFPASFDEWKGPSDVSKVLVESYEALLNEVGRDESSPANPKKRTDMRNRDGTTKGGGAAVTTRSGRTVNPVNHKAPK